VIVDLTLRLQTRRDGSVYEVSLMRYSAVTPTKPYILRLDTDEWLDDAFGRGFIAGRTQEFILDVVSKELLGPSPKTAIVEDIENV
jgi:hypothetical protein